MRQYDFIQRQMLEDIMDSLSEDGCPDDFVRQTAESILAESSEPLYLKHTNGNPYWEPIEPDIDAGFENPDRYPYDDMYPAADTYCSPSTLYCPA